MSKDLGITDEAISQMRKNGIEYKVIAASLGVSIGLVQGRIFRYEQSKRKKGVVSNPKLFDIDIGTPLAIEGDAMIVGDIHVPTTDYDFAQLVGAVAKKNKIKKLILAGDFFSMDIFSSYPAITKLSTWQHEKEASRQLMDEWEKIFDSIDILMGNHDRRLQKWTGGQLNDTDIFAHLLTSSKVRSSNWGWCTLTSGGKVWRITHPKNYSINQLTVADTLANKFQMNIISHHEHHLAIGWDRFKRFVLINNGGLFDLDKLAYVVLDDSKHASMAKGFTMIKNGYPYVYGESPFTDWESVL